MDGIKRNLFPILQNKYYLNTCSIGPLALPVKEAMDKFITEWETEGGLAWGMNDGWTEKVEKARKEFANLIHAKSEEIAFSFGNSVAMSSITSALDLKKEDEIIFNELDFPATTAHVMGKEELGIHYKIAQSKDGKTISPEDYKKVLNKKTKLVTACHVISNSGFKVDINELTKISHERGIQVFIDAYQSLGTISIDVKKQDLDYLASGCLKWILGGFGISFIYIREELIDKLNPSSIGWMGMDSPFTDLYDKPRSTLHRPKTALKFQYGTPYPIGATTAYEGMKIISSIGIKTIEYQNQQLTQEIITKAKEKGFKLLTSEEKENRGSIVNIQIPDAERIVTELKDKNFVLDYRAGGVRVSPHFFNNSEDIEKLFSEISSTIN